MPRKLKDSVIVITGASSGIGRATALLFANKGATVVLAARREKPLKDLAEECTRLGARALAVSTDQSKEADVQNLARQAIEQFGRLDVWVNNASVILFSRFEKAPPDVFRQVIETNLFGYIYGARAALPQFREQGSGVLINNSSVLGAVGAPYLSAYTASKFAIRGFGQSLRQELLHDRNIHVCTVLPAAIDTPFFQHAANYTGRAVKPLRPTYEADLVAARIIDLAQRPEREAVVGNAGRFLILQHKLMPGLTERIFARQVEKDHFRDEPAPPTPGNVLQPVDFGTDISGGWKAPEEAQAGRRAALFGAAAAVPAFLAWRRLGNNGRQPPAIRAGSMAARRKRPTLIRRVRRRVAA